MKDDHADKFSLPHLYISLAECNGQFLHCCCADFPVKLFGGEKRVILSTTSWIGGKNPFLGIAYITVGILCLVLGACFLIVHLKFSKR